MKIADKIIVTTESLRESLIDKYKVDCRKVAVIGNGYSEKQWSEIVCGKQVNHKIVISYVGSIVFMNGTYRDTSEFFKAYDMLDNKEIYEIRFIGVTDTAQLDGLKQKYPEILFKEKVSPKESLKYIQQSDVLFNLHTANDNSSKYLIGGKIYDYLRSGKLIWSINSKDSYEQRFLKENSDALCCENNFQEIFGIFNLIKSMAANHTAAAIQKAAIAKYSREYQNNKYYELIKNT